MNYYENNSSKARYWRKCTLWSEDETKALLSGVWPDGDEEENPTPTYISQAVSDAVKTGLLVPVPHVGEIRLARHLVNKFRPNDVILWANKLGCFPSFPFATDGTGMA